MAGLMSLQHFTTTQTHAITMVQVALRRRPGLRITYGYTVALVVVLALSGIWHFNGDDVLEETRPLLSSSTFSFPERLEENPRRQQSRVSVRAEREQNINKIDELDWLGEEWKDKECVPFDKWQLMENSPSACNMMHEMDIAEPGELHFVNCGGSRCAFSITNNLGEKVILKWTK